MTGQAIIDGIRATLADVGFDYETAIRDFGQVEASEARQRGETFDKSAHLRGLILSVLSNQRPWKPIAENLSEIEAIFFHFDVERVEKADPVSLSDALKSIRCGNRQIGRQMASLKYNLRIFDIIEHEFGSLDAFVTSSRPTLIAKKISAYRSPYKLRQVGFTLALEYLRNMGVQAIKPDLHVRRMLGGSRLGFVNGHPTEEEAYNALASLARGMGANLSYVDNLFWLFCAKGYGEVCGADPRCGICRLSATCTQGTADN